MTNSWTIFTVEELQASGHLLVEDGNHGEYRPLPEDFTTTGMAFIRAADMDEGRILFQSASRINQRALTRIRKGIGNPCDVLLSHKGTVGKIALAYPDCEPFVCSPQTTFWRSLDHNIIDYRYLYYYLQSSNFQRQLNARKGETDMADYVSLTAQRKLHVVIPPLPEQQAIVYILGSLEDKIELNRQMNETLEGIAQALFKSWFVDFDPVRAKMEGRQPYGMDAEIAELFPNELEDLMLDKIPRGWKVGKLSDVVLIDKKSVAPDQQADEVFSHYSIPAFDSGRLPIREKGKQIKSNKFLVPKGTVLLSKINPTTPRVWLPSIKENEHRSICSTEFLVVLSRGVVSTEYLYTLFKTPDFREKFTALTTGTSNSHQRVKSEYLLSMDFLIPNPKLVEHFTYLAQALYSKMTQNLTELQDLSALRDTLLPKLLSGAIRVKDAEKAVESVL